MMIADRIRGGMWGLLTGDALGVPHEFKPASAIPTQIDMVMPAAYKKTYAQVPYGTWSDDGALALALADSLATLGHFNVADVAHNFIEWKDAGRYAVDGNVFDIGITTSMALTGLAAGRTKIGGSGASDERSNGNGSLMRTLPLALWHTGSDKQLFFDAADASAITHAHPVSMAACGVYCIAARRILTGEGLAVDAFANAFEIALGFSSWTKDLKIPEPDGTGYVLDSLSYAMRAVSADAPYPHAVIGAIKLGNDTDTTAAIAGGIVGVRAGLDGIPRVWLDAMRGREVATDIIDRLIAVRST